MVMVKVSETYDLSTEVNKMGIIGIHTPSTAGLVKMWKGLMLNHRYMRLVGCDVTIACASMLPADPLQVGVESGKIAPQDMFNPILYTAVSNDSFNALLSKIYGATDVNGLTSVNKSELDDNGAEELGDPYDDFKVYYGLLADPDGFRKAMPQSGLEMRGLYPIVYQLVNTFGNQWKQGDYGTFVTEGTRLYNELQNVPIESLGIDSDLMQQVPALRNLRNAASTFRGPSMRMPRIPTMVPYVSQDIPGSENKAYDEFTTPNDWPKTYVACILTPPAKLNKLYYRMKVTWTIEFTEVRPIQETQGIFGYQVLSQSTYGTDYEIQSSKMTKKTNSVDVAGADIEQIMEGTK